MTFNFIFSIIAAVFSIVLAFFVLFRDRHSLVHWIFSVGMLVLAIEAVSTGISIYALSPAEVLRWQRFGFLAGSLIPGIWLLFSLTFGRANYKEFLSKWKWPVLAIFTLPIGIVAILGGDFFEGLDLSQFSVGSLRIGWAGYLFHLIFLMGAVLILMNLERTLRTSSGRMRWQIKFMILGIGSLFGVRIYTASQIILFRSLSLDLQVINNGALIVASILIMRALFRARIFNVDFYVSHTFLYNSLVILFVGIYLFAVGILAKLAIYFEGPIALPFGAFFLFLGLLGLVIFLLSDRLRKRLKWFISRNFERPIHDYQKEWTKFTQQTTRVTEIKDLCSVITKMVSKTLDVLSVTIWLLDEKSESVELGGTTIFSEKQLQDLPSIQKDVMELILVIRREKLPVDFDFSEGKWAKEEGKANRDLISLTRIRHCLPLIASGKFLGVMTLSDRVGNEPLSSEDFDLLKTIADQTAGSLLNLKLSANLRKAKEMEAFQTMSAFFVHDLKNLASKLSLTMQNLPIHFDNAEFRNDAVRTISQSLAKINGMCSRLSSLGQKLELQRTEADLNELVKNTISGLNGCFRTSLVVDLHPLAKIDIDQEQIQRVLVNLILNANEAIKEGGEIRVTTEHQDGFIVLSVSDNGCGMSKEFVQNSLFRPFQTTKKQGMGIGLYHSKMIVEAHGGRMEVESEEGKGTTMRVLLPI
ncbi:MAG: XrtA/PEP-CTERM system histidine kinase PrsK [Thermodesulfobacteriota bacterium]